MAPEITTAQIAKMSEQEASTGTNEENTGTEYDTWDAAVGDLADSNGLSRNTPSGVDFARPAQPQPFENDDGYFSFLNQLSGHDDLSPPEHGSAGHAIPQDLYHLQQDGGHNGSYLTHPYAPGQGFVQQEGTHYMPYSTPQPEFIGHHQHDDLETHPPTPELDNQIRWALANDSAPAMDSNRLIDNYDAYPPHISSPPRYRGMDEHAPRYSESQAVPHGVAPLTAPSAGRFQQPQPDYGSQQGVVTPNVQPQFQHAQHILPRAQPPDTDVQFVSDDVLAQAAEVARPLQEPQPRKLAFGNLAQAQTAMAARKLKQAWKVDQNDATRPQNNQKRAAYVIQLLDALEDISQATDSHGPTTAFTKRWANHPTDPYYNAKEMETVCWKMLDIAERLHAHGPAALSIFDPPSLANIWKSRNMDFAERIIAICDLLRRSKSRCDKLMKGEALETLVGAPKQKMMNVETNKAQNAGRAVYINTGRKAVKAAKEVEVPAQPAPVCSTDGLAGQQQPAPDKGTKPPGKARKQAPSKPVKDEDLPSNLYDQTPFAPPNGGKIGAPQAFDGLHTHIYAPQAGGQYLNPSQTHYGNSGTVAANQSVNNHGHSQIYCYPQPVPYQISMAQYPPPLHQPGPTQFQRLASPARYNAHPPTGRRRSPSASPPQARKRSVDETGSEGSESPSKRQHTA